HLRVDLDDAGAVYSTVSSRCRSAQGRWGTSRKVQQNTGDRRRSGVSEFTGRAKAGEMERLLVGRGDRFRSEIALSASPQLDLKGTFVNFDTDEEWVPEEKKDRDEQIFKKGWS